MLELIFVLGFFFMLLLTGISLLGIVCALFVATLLMFAGGLFALMIKVLPWLLLAVAVVWIFRAFKEKKSHHRDEIIFGQPRPYRRTRRRYTR